MRIILSQFSVIRFHTVQAKISQEATMKLTSPDFNEGGSIPERCTCDGRDTSPTLKIAEVPQSARSLVLF